MNFKTLLTSTHQPPTPLQTPRTRPHPQLCSFQQYNGYCNSDVKIDKLQDDLLVGTTTDSMLGRK
jgi:hypothetical protein